MSAPTLPTLPTPPFIKPAARPNLHGISLLQGIVVLPIPGTPGCLSRERERSGSNAMERPRLVMSPWIKGRQMTYECSACGQVLVPPEDRAPMEAATELQAPFQEHVRERHSGEAND